MRPEHAALIAGSCRKFTDMKPETRESKVEQIRKKHIISVEVNQISSIEIFKIMISRRKKYGC